MKTQNDLSYDTAKLDLQALHRTAQIAYWKCLTELRERSEDELRRWDKDNAQNGPSSVYLEGIRQTAEQLEHCGNMYSTLTGALKRANVEIVNKKLEVTQ
jgi:hypothetical protein